MSKKAMNRNNNQLDRGCKHNSNSPGSEEIQHPHSNQFASEV